MFLLYSFCFTVAPRIRIKVADTNVTLGQNATLVYEVFAVPAPLFTWSASPLVVLRVPTESSPDTAVYRTRLPIVNAAINTTNNYNFYNYKCVASNNVSSTSSAARVTVLSKKTKLA